VWLKAGSAGEAHEQHEKWEGWDKITRKMQQRDVNIN
jgi:hypothetical protein